MSNGSDTTTALNPAAGGDEMDESLATQADGETVGKRPRVQVGFEADDPRQRLVSADHPLPVESRSQLEYLAQIADDIHAIRFILERNLTT